MEHAGSTQGTGTPKRLVRTPDGKIAGVASGIGHYLGLDPTIVRIAFIVLTFAGGAGLLLYVVSWIVMPKGEADEARPASDLDAWAIVGVVGLVAGVGLLVGWNGIGDGGRAIVAVALVVGGALLVSRNTRGGEGGATPAWPQPPEPAPDAPTRPEPPAETTEVTVAASPEPTQSVAADAATDARFPVTGIVLSLLAIGLGLWVAAAAADWIDVTWATAVAGALLVIGVGLVVAAVAGGAPWLIVLGSVLALALIPAVAVDTLVDDGVGERDHVVTSVTDLDERYELGIGDLQLDLLGLELGGETRVVEVSVGIGSATILVPADVDVELHGHVDAGRLEAPNGDEVDGLDRDLDRIDLVPASTGRIVLELDVGLGEGTVSRGF